MASHFQLRDCITSVSLPCVIDLEIVMLIINTHFQTFANAIAETTILQKRHHDMLYKERVGKHKRTETNRTQGSNKLYRYSSRSRKGL